jgi:uncharacterized membrane protein
MSLLGEKKELITNFHLHAITVHFPCALYPVTAILGIVFLITQNPYFIKLSFVTLSIANLGAVVSFLSGLYDRRYKYIRWDSIFRKKTILSIALSALGVIAWISLICMACSSKETSRCNGADMLYLVLAILALPALTIALGYYGLILSYGRYGGKTSYKPDFSKEIKFEPPDIEIEGYYKEE